MPASTRSTARPSTPDNTEIIREADTIKKSRFYQAWDEREEGESQTAIAARIGTSQTTVSRWLKERTQIGSPAYRKTRRRLEQLGRRSKVTKEMC